MTDFLRIHDDTQRILTDIPEEHSGAHFERVFPAFHPQQNTCQLERAFAQTWAALNEREGTRNVLVHLLHPNVWDLARAANEYSRAECAPRTAREWEVAQFAAASFAQWLPTSAGCAFLRDAFKCGGGDFKYRLPGETRWTD